VRGAGGTLAALMHAHAATHKPHARLGDAWTLETLEAVARGQAIVELPLEARHKIDRSRKLVDDLAARGDAAPNVYGVNTGFGALAETRISATEVRRLQKNLVRSHATGVGPDMPERGRARHDAAPRADLRAGSLGGRARWSIDLLLAMLEPGVVPRVPAQGSVGASGDLAPLAHLALAMIGEGEARRRRVCSRGGEALARGRPRAAHPSRPRRGSR
jgi:histidine ammonia-lyase